MVSKETREYVKQANEMCKKKPTEYLVNALYQASKVAWHKEKDETFGRKTCLLARKYCEQIIEEKTGVSAIETADWCRENGRNFEIVNLWYEILLELARNQHFDSYMLYLERNREPKNRFYINRREQFKKIGLIDALQDTIERKYEILTYSLPPGVGKSTLEKFLMSAVMGWFPYDFSIFFSYSADIARKFYDGVLDILTSDEYCWKTIFPTSETRIRSTNAKSMTIDIGNFKAFASLQCTSIEAGNAGRIRANRFLLCDDLIAGVEEALNMNLLDKKWQKYAVDSRQRKIDNCQEIHIATRWSVHDIIGRIATKYANNPKVKIIAAPDIDPTTGESNFDFEYEGFSTEFFHDQEKIMDEVSYRCLYKNQPIEREGLLYHEDDLRYYLELPPDTMPPDAILGVCDTKEKGTDYMFMPILRQYGENYYLVDCLCDDSIDFSLQYERISRKIIENGVQMMEFESNQGGERIAYEIKKRLKDEGYTCNITTKPTETNKETRIIVNSEWIKLHVLFKDRTMYAPNSDYDKMFKMLLGWSQTSKNPHDDVPDGLANFVRFVENKFKVATVSVPKNPFSYL